METKIIKKVVGLDPRSPGHHIYSKYSIPRLGLVILGTILKNLGAEVRVFLEDFGPIDWEKVRQADLVMISSITPTTPRAYEFADQVREMGIPVVIGGPHVTFLPEEALMHADYVVRFEGEKAIQELVSVFKKELPVSKVSNLSWKNSQGRIIHNPLGPATQNLDEIPDPDFDLVENWEDRRIIPLETSRGCPHNCEFCSVRLMFGQEIRHASPEKVIRQIKALKPQRIFFCDDHFLAKPNEAKRLLEKMTEELDRLPPWSAQIRAKVARKRELLGFMARTGCDCVYVGFESINPETLKEYGKLISVEDIRVCVRNCHSVGIKVHGMFVLGADSDSVETIRDTLSFARNLEIDTVQFLILTPLPGTPFYDKIQPRVIERNWHYYDAHHVVFEPKKMDPLTLQKEALKAMARFYSRWEIAKQLFLLFLRWRMERSFVADWKWKLRNLKLRIAGNRIVGEWLKYPPNIDFMKRLRELLRARKE